MLASPDVEDPLVPEIAARYISDYDRFCETAKLYTAQYATGTRPRADEVEFATESGSDDLHVPPDYRDEKPSTPSLTSGVRNFTRQGRILRGVLEKEKTEESMPESSRPLPSSGDYLPSPRKLKFDHDLWIRNARSTPWRGISLEKVLSRISLQRAERVLDTDDFNTYTVGEWKHPSLKELSLSIVYALPPSDNDNLWNPLYFKASTTSRYDTMAWCGMCYRPRWIAHERGEWWFDWVFNHGVSPIGNTFFENRPS